MSMSDWTDPVLHASVAVFQHRIHRASGRAMARDRVARPQKGRQGYCMHHCEASASCCFGFVPITCLLSAWKRPGVGLPACTAIANIMFGSSDEVPSPYVSLRGPRQRPRNAETEEPPLCYTSRTSGPHGPQCSSAHPSLNGDGP